MPLLRAVIHECHRFLLFYPDPSELIMQPPRAPSPGQKSSKRSGKSSSSQQQGSQKGKDMTRPEELATSPNETEGSRSGFRTRVPVFAYSFPTLPLVLDSSNLIAEQPTAFHAILGITLFLFGNLITHDPNGKSTRNGID
ncbi:hypothetical protein BDM02DRAFT_1691658 [Thelephora ganbajun]|uniref:Uncharacterized protein n=1 Tax=Thelephora ganbajun TaxID=370292 RepID=A0ACB6ZKU2_THEGA|nr:hypothetical protein BDM02DRAFT_1691658 [Thelephora ganbajun]